MKTETLNVANTTQSLVSQVFDSIAGEMVWGARIAGGMLTVQFGAARTVTKRSGRQVEVGEYALHVQCPWRIVKDSVIVVSSLDYVFGESEDNSLELSQAVNLLVDDMPKSYTVKRITRHGFEIGIAGNVEIHAYIFDCSLVEPEEVLRLLKPDSSAEHLVVLSDGTSG